MAGGDAFFLEDVIAQPSMLPECLRSKDAERWLCEVCAELRKKNCGREELAWLLQVPVEALNEQLPASAAPELLGVDLLNIAFLPRGAGCSIKDSRSAAHLNGRKCTLVQDMTEEASHAQIIVEGGTEPTFGEGHPGKTMLLARKNLEFSRLPADTGSDGWPLADIVPLELLPEEQPDWAKRPVHTPAELLGESWLADTGLRAEHLRSTEAQEWLTGVVRNLVHTKSCGKEEVVHLLRLSKAGCSAAGFGGPALPPSVTAEHYGTMLEELTYIPYGSVCRVEESNSYAHLNGLTGRVVEDCPDGETHCKMAMSNGEQQQLHRKNLRLVDPANPDAGAPATAAHVAEAAPAVASQPQAGAVGDVAAGPPAPVLAPPAAAPAADAGGGLFTWLLGCTSCTKAVPADKLGGVQPPYPAAAATLATPAAVGAAASGATPVFCSQCGFKYTDAARFCASCGRPRV